MTKQIKLYLLFTFTFLIGQTIVLAQRIVTDAYDFGFEGTSVVDWTQVAGFESESAIVASGNKSMRASMNYPQQSPKLQTFRESNSSNGTFDLVAGAYTLSVMVYLVGDVPSELKISPTSAPFMPNLSLQGVNKGEWVKLETTFTVAENEAKNDAWVVIQFLNTPDSGSGTVYIDDIVISGEEIPGVEEIPSIVKIETLGDTNLNLTKGTYEISMSVWLDPAATIKSFYSNVEDPWASIKWDLEGIAKGEWVELNETFRLDDDAVDSKFIVQVNNNPEYGGGVGVFYLDNITIVKSKEAYEESDNFLIQTIGETCPDQNNGQIIITAKAIEDYIVEFNGQNYNFSNELSIENIAPETYNLCISVKNTTFKTCFELTIDEASSVSGKVVNMKSGNISVDMEGGTAPYTVFVNDISIFQTEESTFELSVKHGDVIKVASSKDCESLFIENIEGLQAKIYPNPVTDVLHVALPKEANIILFDMLGNKVYSKNNVTKELEIAVDTLTKGVYVIQVLFGSEAINYKLIVN